VAVKSFICVAAAAVLSLLWGRLAKTSAAIQINSASKSLTPQVSIRPICMQIFHIFFISISWAIGITIDEIC
jgi:hypothetical protein